MDNKKNLAKKIDHTILKADTKKETVVRYCQEAKEYGFASVCVNSYYAPLVSEELKGTDIKTCCVVGFPLGAMSTRSKAFEARDAVEAGASEIDMVINIGALKDHDDHIVVKDIEEVVKAASPALVKVIIETSLLNEEEKIRACNLAVEAGADFVKTSTGFSSGGARVEDIRLMKNTVGDRALIKASGGIRSPEDMDKMLEAGADRIGASNGVALL